jgi:hypothetical protein
MLRNGYGTGLSHTYHHKAGKPMGQRLGSLFLKMLASHTTDWHGWARVTTNAVKSRYGILSRFKKEAMVLTSAKPEKREEAKAYAVLGAQVHTNSCDEL